MMGHRGVRLGITYPEVTEMQVRAIFEAAAELKKAGKSPKPELMVPVTCDVPRTRRDEGDFRPRAEGSRGADRRRSCRCLYGTMIEIPRACLTADKMAKTAQFFSFGTNDLTQMSFGFSRDDIGSFLHDYLEDNILAADPFQTIDQSGVGQLIQMAVTKGRSTRGNLKVGICGEQGGDPASVEFCFRYGIELRQLQPVPRADRPAGRGPGGHQGEESQRTSGENSWGGSELPPRSCFLPSLCCRPLCYLAGGSGLGASGAIIGFFVGPSLDSLAAGCRLATALCWQQLVGWQQLVCWQQLLRSQQLV